MDTCERVFKKNLFTFCSLNYDTCSINIELYLYSFILIFLVFTVMITHFGLNVMLNKQITGCYPGKKINANILTFNVDKYHSSESSIGLYVKINKV